MVAMPRPRKEIRGGETVSVPVRLDKNDIEWVDREVTDRGYMSRADVLREALKFYRWSKEYKRTVEDEIASLFSDPRQVEAFADLVGQSVMRKLGERMQK